MTVFEAESVMAGIPYRVLPTALIEAMMPGGIVRFRSVEQFVAAIDALQKSPGRDRLSLRELVEGSTARRPNGAPAEESAPEYVSVLRNAIESTCRDPSQVRALVYDRARLTLRRALLFEHSSMHWTEVVRHISEFETAVEKVEKGISSEATAFTSIEAQEVNGPRIYDEYRSAGDIEASVFGPVDYAPTDIDAANARPESNEDLAFRGTSLQVLHPTEPPSHLPAQPHYPDAAHIDSHSNVQYFYQWNRVLMVGLVMVTVVLVAGIISAGLVLLSTKLGQVQLASTATDSKLRPPPFVGEPKSAKLPYPIPTAYGVYALNQNALVELKSLPIPVPDARVGISAEFEMPNTTKLSDGEPAFVIFRRGLAASAPEKLFIRVIASMKRQTTIVNAKASTISMQGQLRIRNINYELRVSPVPNHPDMIIARRASKTPLAPGRYAVVFGRSGYDFSIAGSQSSAEFCLEEFQTANGSVFTQCQRH